MPGLEVLESLLRNDRTSFQGDYYVLTEAMNSHDVGRGRGGLAAALSTADGLLLTIANALSHDLYYKMINPSASTQKRVKIGRAHV